MGKHAMYRRRGRGTGPEASPAFPLGAPTTDDFSLEFDGTTLMLLMDSPCPAGPPEANHVIDQVRREPSTDWVDSDSVTCEGSGAVDTEVPPGTTCDVRIAWANDDGQLSDWSEFRSEMLPA